MKNCKACTFTWSGFTVIKQKLPGKSILLPFLVPDDIITKKLKNNMSSKKFINYGTS